MADQDWNGLPYGHFGQATYNSEDQSWLFAKQPDLPRILEPLGTPDIAIKPCKWSIAEHSSAELPSQRHEREIKEATRKRPETQPATSLLRPLLQASEAVEAATDRHDPVKGSLLSFGRVFDEQVRRSKQIVAFASGATGSDVKVVQMQTQRQGWDDSRETWLEVPVIANEEAFWRSQGSPILQVCFAQPLENVENLLAVRTESRTLIFKPVLRSFGPGRLKLKLLLELPAGQQHDSAPHADVAFNPWFPRQFAVIDRLEHWSVWEFRSRESSEATCVHSFAANGDNPKADVLNDDWARLLWVCNPNTVAIATRRNVALYDLTSGPSMLQDLNVGVSDLSAWVLDMASLPSDPARVVILTSTHLHLVMFEEEHGEVRAHLEMRIRHFQNPQDITLRPTLYRDEEDLTVILRSALNTTAIAYRLTINSGKATVLYDPAQFECRLGTDSALGFHFQPIAIGEKQSVHSGNSLVRRLRANDYRFVSLVALNKDLSVFSLIYLDHPHRYRNSQITAPKWRVKPGGSYFKIKESFVTDETVIIPSGLEDDLREPVANYVKQRRRHSRCLTGRESTVNHERIAHVAQQYAAQTESMDDVIVHIRDLLERPMEPVVKPMTTAFEISNKELTTNDMERNSNQVQQLMAMQNEPSDEQSGVADGLEIGMKLVIRPVLENSLLPWAPLEAAGADLTLTYERIISQWISQLSDAVPGRIRLAKEQLARRIAAEVHLAGHVIRPEEPEGPKDTYPETAPESQSQSWELPMRGAEHSQASQFSNALASQSALLTPSPTGTPSVTTASSRTSAFTSAEVSRLSKYVRFTKPAPSALPRSINKVLDHWTVGADPAEYDWIAASRRITQRTEEEEAESQLTEKQRARMHRKAERHIRRQRKEAAASQQQHLASSQMPELVVSASQPQFAGGKVESQPAPGPGGILYSGGLGSSQVRAPGAASQATVGRFGGRQPAKKKRKQGF